MNLRYTDWVQPSTQWDVVLYVDSNGSPEQRDALENIFLGRYGGTVLSNFAAAIGNVLAVRPARIRLVHVPGEHRILVDNVVEVTESGPFQQAEPVACGIPGLDHPGQESKTSRLKSAHRALNWDIYDVCGFSTDFDYRA
jgi:hypothetical protein